MDVKFDGLERCIKQCLILKNDVYTFRRSPGWGNLRNVQIKSLPLLIDGMPVVVDPFLLYQTMSVRGTAEDPLPTVSLDPLAWIPTETVSEILRHYPGAVGLALLTNGTLIIVVAPSTDMGFLEMWSPQVICNKRVTFSLGSGITPTSDAGMDFRHDLALLQSAPQMISPRPMVFDGKANLGFNKLIRLFRPSPPRELDRLSTPENWGLCIGQAYVQSSMSGKMSPAATKETVFAHAYLWRNHGHTVDLHGFFGVPLELIGPGSAEKATIIGFQNFQIPKFCWTADIKRDVKGDVLSTLVNGDHTLYGAFEVPDEIVNGPSITAVDTSFATYATHAA